MKAKEKDQSFDWSFLPDMDTLSGGALLPVTGLAGIMYHL